MTTKKLKKVIKERFGSMTKFAALIKVDRYELQKFFAAADKNYTKERKQRVLELHALALNTPVENTDTELTEEIRTALEARIEELGGVSKFCEDHPEFSKVSVWHILNGTRKTVNPTVKKLIEITQPQTTA
jgi:HD-GYP domain-containing protein (c-di-GMP phosphodiesterase class II)